ncbi:uncharacterized protein LOC144548757 isoform X1 [Carex rostrata]
MNSWTSTRLYSIASVSKEAGFVRCLVINGKYEKAEAEAVVLLQDLVSVLAPARKVPRSKKGKGTGAEPYLGILALVEQVQPWILSLDHEAAKWNHVMVVKPLYRCAAFLTRECRSFDHDLFSSFCLTMLRECAMCSFNQLTIQEHLKLKVQSLMCMRYTAYTGSASFFCFLHLLELLTHQSSSCSSTCGIDSR